VLLFFRGHAEVFFYWRGPALVQYWRSFEDLERFARNPDDPHMPAWQRFNRSVGSDGSVGIFHETYLVERRSLRGDLRQHACLRPRKSDRARQGCRGQRDGAATPHARRKRSCGALAGVGLRSRSALSYRRGWNQGLACGDREFRQEYKCPHPGRGAFIRANLYSHSPHVVLRLRFSGDLGAALLPY
jgi:hypothetical protein